MPMSSKPSYANLGKLKISNHTPISYESLSPSNLKNPSTLPRYNHVSSPVVKSLNSGPNLNPKSSYNILNRKENMMKMHSPNIRSEKSTPNLTVNTVMLKNGDIHNENRNPNVQNGSYRPRNGLKSPKSTPTLTLSSSTLNALNYASPKPSSMSTLMTKGNLGSITSSSSISQQQLLPSSLLFKNRKHSSPNMKKLLSNNNNNNMNSNNISVSPIANNLIHSSKLNKSSIATTPKPSIATPKPSSMTTPKPSHATPKPTFNTPKATSFNTNVPPS